MSGTSPTLVRVLQEDARDSTPGDDRDSLVVDTGPGDSWNHPGAAGDRDPSAPADGAFDSSFDSSFDAGFSGGGGGG